MEVVIRKTFAILLIFTQVYVPNVIADTIILKNGEEIVGDVLKETNEGVVVSKQGGNFVYSISKNRIRIKNIRKSTPEEEERRKYREGRFYRVDKKKVAEQKVKWKEYRLEQYKKEVTAADLARGRIRVCFLEKKFGVVGAVLNDKIKASLMVDTGASFVAISEETAKSLGINLEKLPKIKLTLADGSKIEAYSTKLDSVEVGSARIQNVKTVIHGMSPDDDTDGLLGMSFLQYFRVKLDSKENCLILEKY